MKTDQFLVNRSKYSFDETINALTKEIQEAGWSVLAVHNMQEILFKKNVAILDMKIFELCNGKYSGSILIEDALKIYSPLMPCSLSIYRSEDGEVYISRMNFKIMASSIGGKVEKIMSMAFNDIENILEKLIAK